MSRVRIGQVWESYKNPRRSVRVVGREYGWIVVNATHPDQSLVGRKSRLNSSHLVSRWKLLPTDNLPTMVEQLCVATEGVREALQRGEDGKTQWGLVMALVPEVNNYLVTWRKPRRKIR